MEQSFSYQGTVLHEWVDYNGHMNDAEYNKAFSQATDAFIDHIGLDERTREVYDYTVYTLETHICYMQEMHEGDPFTIKGQILDVDAKRIHLFLTMFNEQGETVATLEEMLMGIDRKEGRGAAFPGEVADKLAVMLETDEQLERPKQAGRTIGIRRK
ncbi:thioesterase family protein [Pontibacillus salipaludis]|uniref:thioesterase family protein n=1 Tax=Pontibacillus salipaludis TaxID=1697394 RepID=UPI0031F091A6